jgi:hypothetical protein
VRIEIREAGTSTAKKPLWLWRVWSNGRMSQGFSATEQEADFQAKQEQSRLGESWGAVHRFRRP